MNIVSDTKIKHGYLGRNKYPVSPFILRHEAQQKCMDNIIYHNTLTQQLYALENKHSGFQAELPVKFLFLSPYQAGR